MLQADLLFRYIASNHKVVFSKAMTECYKIPMLPRNNKKVIGNVVERLA